MYTRLFTCILDLDLSVMENHKNSLTKQIFKKENLLHLYWKLSYIVLVS